MDFLILDKKLRNLFGASEDWDSDGVQVGVPGEITRAVVSLDCTSAAIMFAKKAGAGVIVTHHPLFFDPTPSKSVLKRESACKETGVSVLSYHTCFDIVKGGVNDVLCEAVGVSVDKKQNFLPFGRLGSLGESVSFGEFLNKCETSLGVAAQNIFDAGKNVKKVAVISGGGKDYIEEVYNSGVDTYLTGEVNHAAIVDCREYGINLLCLTHFATENIAVPRLAEYVGRFVPEVICYGV